MVATLRKMGPSRALIAAATVLVLAGGAAAGTWQSPAAGPPTPAGGSAGPSTAQGAPAAPAADSVSAGSSAYYGSASDSEAERAAQDRRNAERTRVEDAQDRFYADELARSKARMQQFERKSSDYYKRP